MTSWFGVDISKATLSISVRPQGVAFDTSNDAEGHQLLLNCLSAPTPARLRSIHSTRLQALGISTGCCVIDAIPRNKLSDNYP